MLILDEPVNELYLLATDYIIIHKGKIIETPTHDELTDKCQKYVSILVSNCLKYSSGNVVFKIIESEAITLTIENPAANLKDIDSTRLFDRFYKGDSSRTIGGIGLGVPIAEMIIENMDGEIQAYVTDEIFTVKIKFSKYEK